MTTTLSRRLAGTLAALLLALAGALALAGPTQAADPVRIMPLGDSITGNPGCWRALLWQKLQQGGHTDVDMVGTLPAQGCGVAHDGDNEGHGGYLVTDVAAQGQLVGWLAATDPDVVVMHFGTNDVWSARTTQQILDAYTTLVQQMRASNPQMRVLVAQIIPVAPPTCAQCPARTAALNAAIPAWAAGITTAQSPVVVVDQATGWVPATDTSDGVHPDEDGIVKLADRWYPALAAVLDGTTPTPTPTPTPTVSPTPTPTPTPSVTPTPTPTPGGATCTASYAVSSQWQGGFVASVRVTATSPVSSWTVAVTLPGGAVQHAWSATATTSGSTATFANAAWNGTLAAGQQADLGFQGTGSPTASAVTCTATR
ncbi:cellulose binding domain-containing protein [Cellulomonas fimi]|uniref:Cellulose-binding family II n=1 Tax=Cellulomonas fimi (strain ATCC 484 / DSM 20113 / JCM 1341 / CCUG 24087 / LMG 16345 / NBRC 15513 / NCIMB 8980 / NCTC 7547 / NRS-133) TaxID=590998 RepID=F4H4Y4_CELFA|nr:cellulose binding domain-containing protein [Cellulomonas fimi]AEE45464.1 cellulose-binding family II [Cellulomonas fimi ATCC 484]NNH07310.1 cellulose-binding protein [Cellulomonas fimi]VEH29483.1 Endoglucanase CelA precursor [Cellulomonas fimi]